MDRTRAWLAVSPVVGAGVLAAHVLAYRLTGASGGALHSYLDHAPQVLLLAAIVALALAGLGSRLPSPAAWTFPAAALATFVVQEHVERLVHTGELPVLITSPAFLVGLLLQVPVALGAWALARALLRAVEEHAPRGSALPRLLVELLVPVDAEVVPAPVRPLPGRGPPSGRRR